MGTFCVLDQTRRKRTRTCYQTARFIIVSIDAQSVAVFSNGRNQIKSSFLFSQIRPAEDHLGGLKRIVV
jgi:hypothetical protein